MVVFHPFHIPGGFSPPHSVHLYNYDDVNRRVENKKNRRDETKNNDPHREASKIRASAEVHFVNDINFMHVEEYAKDVAEKKGGYDHHENPGEVFFLLLCVYSLHLVLYSKIYFIVKKADSS